MRPPRPSSPTNEGPLAGRALFDAIGRALKRASGPGRARAWRKWAQAIRKDDPRYRLARNVIARANKILSLRRKGASDYADLLVERLDAARGQAEALRAGAALRSHRRGKPKGALRKSTRLLIALRRQHPDDSAAQFFERLRTHEQFFARDADTIVCRRDARIIKRGSFSSLLSKLALN